MVVKYVIYFAIALYFLALIGALLKKTKLMRFAFLTGFLMACLAFLFRWLNKSHIPLQNMFEIFLFMGLFVYPVSIFCRSYLFIKVDAIDISSGILFLIVAQFIFHSPPQQLPPALQSWLFIPHVISYLIGYIIMIKAASQSLYQIININDLETSIRYERSAYHLICFGFPFLTFGLLLGSWWGKLAWGDYWNWDPKELWSLVTWLIYVGYFHFRYMFGRKYTLINSSIVFSGFLMILITLLWVNLSKIFSGLHTYSS
jgi:ABC-type transport system involved in cytochrome c biogenesis permease subunit